MKNFNIIPNVWNNQVYGKVFCFETITFLNIKACLSVFKFMKLSMKV